MAAAIAALRVYFDKSETATVRVAAESLICGFLTVCVGSGLSAFGFGQDLYLLCAGVIGFMGTQWVRKVAKQVFMSKFGE